MRYRPTIPKGHYSEGPLFRKLRFRVRVRISRVRIRLWFRVKIRVSRVRVQTARPRLGLGIVSGLVSE